MRKSNHGVFSEVTGGRPSSFQEVMEWGTPWPRAKRGEQGGGRRARRLFGGHHPSVTS